MWADRRLALMACGLCLGSGVLAGDEDTTPEVEFLEYLGMWEESDEDWLMVDDVLAAENEERSDPAPEGEESTETKDES